MMSWSALAQSYGRASYAISFPASGNRNFVSQPSFLGASLEFGSYVTDFTMGGLEVGWRTLYEKFPDKTTAIENTTVTGDQLHYLNIVPILAKYTLEGTFLEDLPFVPYASVGAGMYFVERRVDVGLFSLKNSGWSVALSPEIGLTFPKGSARKFHLSVEYDIFFKTSYLSRQSLLGINLGISY